MPESNQRAFEAKAIGYIAFEITSEDQSALVMGSSSRGIFVKTPGKWLLFISFESFRGPLTITLDGAGVPLRHLSAGTPLRIASGLISFQDANMVVSFKNSQVWHAPFPSASPIPTLERNNMLISLAKDIMAGKSSVGLSSLLPYILGLSNAHLVSASDFNPNQADILRLQGYMRKKDATSLSRLVLTILGAGPGLTPSGDDFIIGLLLSLNRWRDVLWSEDGLDEFNRSVVEAAYQKTTSLSANLIECAAHGQADERLIDALDCMMCGGTRESEIVTNLLGWGSSSGVDAFVGMAVALLAQPPILPHL